jgi:diaminohydroxyphosphoribosylaminopyrimidine deaminase / 5-amino-6-(5-phosphoribosylamino)uracil reductase
METHEAWMRFALQLAQAAEGQTSPNPMVGAVVVKDGQMMGLGAHVQAGTPHAEVHALEMAAATAKGATLYVTLEPCPHVGRTPPCTEKIIQSGVKQVVIGSVDLDPRVSGKGITRLKEAGIEVLQAVLEKECLQLNEAYFYHRRTGRPFVTLKTATTLDGKIATANGDSRWITGKEARQFVHQLRHRQDAILVGIGTVLTDNPALTVRLQAGGKNPIRVIVDSHLRTPLQAKITNVAIAPTWIFTTDHRDIEKEKQLRAKGVQVISTGIAPLVDWKGLLHHLGGQGILSLLVEGGGQVNASLLRGGYVNKVIALIAPKLLGGATSPTSIAGESPAKVADASRLSQVTVAWLGEDVCFTGYLK